MTEGLMAIAGITENDWQESRRRSDQIAQVVVRFVNADMTGRPVDQVYRALNARLHAADVALDSEEVWEYADLISDGTWMPRR
jgi:hypothetical protein